MGTMTMMEKGACRDDLIELPLYYMNDYSVMGLLVPRLAPAVQVLEARGFEVESKGAAARIRFEGPEQMARIFKVLTSDRIPFDMTDLMDQAYQG